MQHRGRSTADFFKVTLLSAPGCDTDLAMTRHTLGADANIRTTVQSNTWLQDHFQLGTCSHIVDRCVAGIALQTVNCSGNGHHVDVFPTGYVRWLLRCSKMLVGSPACNCQLGCSDVMFCPRFTGTIKAQRGDYRGESAALTETATPHGEVR
jgi:hypothetical protein